MNKNLYLISFTASYDAPQLQQAIFATQEELDVLMKRFENVCMWFCGCSG
jgi:hypothetical protein